MVAWLSASAKKGMRQKEKLSPRIFAAAADHCFKFS
jgi:hypothetical protein